MRIRYCVLYTFSLGMSNKIASGAEAVHCLFFFKRARDPSRLRKRACTRNALIIRGGAFISEIFEICVIPDSDKFTDCAARVIETLDNSVKSD